MSTQTPTRDGAVLLTPTDAARLAKVLRDTIYREIDRGVLPALHVGRLLRIEPRRLPPLPRSREACSVKTARSYLNPGGHNMKSQETDIRDHETGKDAFRAEVHRSRQAVSKRQDMFASLIFGADDVGEHEPKKTKPRSGWSVNSVLGTKAERAAMSLVDSSTLGGQPKAAPPAGDRGEHEKSPVTGWGG